MIILYETNLYSNIRGGGSIVIGVQATLDNTNLIKKTQPKSGFVRLDDTDEFSSLYIYIFLTGVILKYKQSLIYANSIKCFPSFFGKLCVFIIFVMQTYTPLTE